jgi:methionyl-tRNA formyltransferase
MTGRAAPPRRLVYFGTPAMAVPPLQALVAAGFDVVCVVTRVDKRRGRGGELMPSPVKAAAVELGLHRGAHRGRRAARRRPRRRPRGGGRVRPADQAARAGRPADGEPALLVAAALARRRTRRAGDARGRRRHRRVLDAAGGGARHRSRARRGRGADRVRCDRRLTAGRPGADRHRPALRRAHRRAAPTPPQVGEPTYAAKLSPDDLRLDWATPASVRDRQIRLGGAWTTFRDKRLKVHAAEVVDPHATGDEPRPTARSAGSGSHACSPKAKPAMAYARLRQRGASAARRAVRRDRPRGRARLRSSGSITRVRTPTSCCRPNSADSGLSTRDRRIRHRARVRHHAHAPCLRCPRRPVRRRRA